MPLDSYPSWIQTSVSGLPAFVSLTQLSDFMQRSKKQITNDIKAGKLKKLKSKGGQKRKALVSRLHVAEYLNNLYALEGGK